MKENQYIERYNRHIQLAKIGLIGQEKLSNSSVLIIGVGGLGCPVLQYLSAAGIGNIGIVDHDIVSLSNLQRQILFHTNDIGKLKVDIAKHKMELLNDLISIQTFPFKLATNNALEIIADYDIIVDCTDNFESRYLINDACMLVNKPIVYGAIHSFEGQVSVFNFKGSGHYRCLFPKPSKSQIPNCSENGVIGVLPGIIGSYQANEVIKCLLNIGEPLANQIMIIDILNNRNQIIKYKKVVQHPDAPSTIAAFKLMDYPLYCQTSTNTNINIKPKDMNEISFKEILPLLADESVTLIDIRESHEQPKFDYKDIKYYPLSQISQYLDELSEDEPIYIFCQHGVRSLNLVHYLEEELDITNAISIKGGIVKMIR